MFSSLRMSTSLCQSAACGISRRQFGKVADVMSAAKSIIKGDDFINPKKLLERKYLYFALIALHYRKLRLAEPGNEDISDLYEKATQELAKDEPHGTLIIDARDGGSGRTTLGLANQDTFVIADEVLLAPERQQAAPSESTSSK